MQLAKIERTSPTPIKVGVAGDIVHTICTLHMPDALHSHCGRCDHAHQSSRVQSKRERERARVREESENWAVRHAPGLCHVFTLSEAAYVAGATTGTRASAFLHLTPFAFAFTSADCRAVDLCFHLDIGPPGSLIGRGRGHNRTCGRIDTGSLFAAKLGGR